MDALLLFFFIVAIVAVQVINLALLFHKLGQHPEAMAGDDPSAMDAYCLYDYPYVGL